MKLLLTLLLFLLTLPAFADINVPSEIVSPPEPLVATVDADIPEGAQSKGRWDIEGTGDAKLIEAGDNTVYIWAQPGEYTVTYTGMWVDFENKLFDFISEEAAVTVTSSDPPDPGPDPGPDPDPNPGQKYQIMMFHDVDKLDNLPAGQREILISLTARQSLEESGHRILEVLDVASLDAADPPDEYKPFIAAVKGEPMPQVAIAPLDGGDVLNFPLPENIQELEKKLAGE